MILYSRAMSSIDALTPADLAVLLDDWEAMSEHFLPGRAGLVAQAIHWLSEQDQSPLVVEIGSGPGNTLRRMAAALDSAQLVGLDVDAVLLRLHDLAEDARLVDYTTSKTVPIIADCVDVADSNWTSIARQLLGDRQPTAIVAIQVLHYFDPETFQRVLDDIAQVLAPGGALIHIDHVATSADAHDDPGPGDDASGDEPQADRADPWTRWWATANRCSDLADHVARREQQLRSQSPSAEYHPDESEFDAHLRRAGFGQPSLRVRHGVSLLTIATVSG